MNDKTTIKFSRNDVRTVKGGVAAQTGLKVGTQTKIFEVQQGTTKTQGDF